MFEKESILAFFGILIHCSDQYWYLIMDVILFILYIFQVYIRVLINSLYPYQTQLKSDLICIQNNRKGKHTGFFLHFNSLFESIFVF